MPFYFRKECPLNSGYLNILLTLCTSLLLTNVAAHAKEVKIGMAIDDLRLERWQKDRDIFVKKAESLGAKVFVQSANGNGETQMSQIENMINRVSMFLSLFRITARY